MNVIKNIIDKSKYSLKCPFELDYEFIVVHNTENDASARNEILYMLRNMYAISFHYAIDDKEIVQGIPENRNTWNAGDGQNGKGNRKGLSIEICYSKSGGVKFTNAEKLASKFIAFKLKEKGWGVDKVTKHQDYSRKYCPRRTMDMGWNRFITMIQDELNILNKQVGDKMEKKYISLKIHNENYKVEGYFIDNTNYIPVRMLEKLGYEVGWENGVITLNYREE